MIHKIIKILFISAAIFFSSGVIDVRAKEDLTGEYLVKAAFIYNFAKFVEWPDEAFQNSEDPIVLCILGKNPFDKATETIRGKFIRGRKLEIRFISKMEGLDKCHILFICRSEMDSLGQYLDVVKKTKILTVADMKGFSELGGIINFIKSGNKIKFKINVDAAKDAGLKISSKLLKLATIVRNK